MARRIGENISREWDEDPWAEDLWNALQLIKKDAPEGAKELESLAKRGSALSMMYLGYALFVGRYGLESNPVVGEEWLRRSAESGSIEGLYMLGRLLQHEGRGAEAMVLFKQAAERGYSPAMLAVGWKYYFGNDTDRDITRAHEYLRRAAKAGHLYGVLWETHTLRQLRKNPVTWIRNLSIRVSLPFRVVWARITYPASDRLRK